MREIEREREREQIKREREMRRERERERDEEREREKEKSIHKFYQIEDKNCHKSSVKESLRDIYIFVYFSII